MSATTLDRPELDPAVKPFHKPRELVDLGFASDPKTIYDAMPTAWIRRAMDLDGPP
jgi:hypothetical protein